MEETRGDLGVGQSRPPEVPGHTEIWGRGLSAVAVWHSLSEGNDGGVSGHNGPGEQLDAVLVGVAREGEGGAPGECSAHLALALGKGMPFFVREPSIAGHVDRGEQ